MFISSKIGVNYISTLGVVLCAIGVRVMNSAVCKHSYI